MCVSPLASKVAEGEPPLLLCVMGTQASVGLQCDCTAAVTAYGLCVRPGKSLHSGGESQVPREKEPHWEVMAQVRVRAGPSGLLEHCTVPSRHPVPSSSAMAISLGLVALSFVPPFFFDHLFPSTLLPHSPTSPTSFSLTGISPQPFPLEVGLSRIFSQLLSSSSHFCFSFRPFLIPFSRCVWGEGKERSSGMHVWPTGTEL